MNQLIACPARCVVSTIFSLCLLFGSAACMDSGPATGTQTGSDVVESSAAGNEQACDGCAENQTCTEGECACMPGFRDCDGIAANGCETEGNCLCELGSQQACYRGPPETENVGECIGGTETCEGNSWSYCEGQVLPVGETCEPDGVDQDCDGEFDEIEDVDGDGFTICDGDCCDDPMFHCADDPALVNPGAYDVAGNELDDDCDGIIDNEPPTGCSESMIVDAPTGAELIMAMDLCQFTEGDPHIWGVIESTTTEISGSGAPFDYQTGVLEGFALNSLPAMQNITLASISSGEARGVGDPGYTTNKSDGYLMDEGGPLEYLAAHDNILVSVDACPVPEASFHDTVRFSTKIRVPTNAMGFKFQFRFFTYEYPYYICTEFNDFFLALLTSEHPDIPLDKNISFDSAGNPVSVNNAFFTTCEPLTCDTVEPAYEDYGDVDQDGCPDSLNCNLETNQCETEFGACPDGAQALMAFSGATDNSGATGWLSTASPVVPGEVITLEFLIWDTGDSAFDSLVLLDNFEWLLEPTELVTKN